MISTEVGAGENDTDDNGSEVMSCICSFDREVAEPCSGELQVKISPGSAKGSRLQSTISPFDVSVRRTVREPGGTR